MAAMSPALDSACFGLARASPQFSALRRVSTGQAVVLVLTAIVLGIALAVWPPLIAVLASPAFLALATLRWACLFRWSRAVDPRPRRLSDAELPVYTVLAPLHREANMLEQLVGSLAVLRYPKDKLDIKLVVEATDHETRHVLAKHRLPPEFEVVVVPPALPLTKPKALNYALAFARGSLITVFDAEDIPEPDQLRLAAESFAASAPDIVCLQARLAFYNSDENWLARQFAIEYAVLFDLQLPMMAALDCAFPLGGTSNHFRIEALERVGRWDPYNVTEDADLGFRLARHGYRGRMIAASTHEEANVALGNWMNQRARWLKGFIQTWLVHMRHPLRLGRELGLRSFLAFQATTIGVVASALLHPVFLAYLAVEIARGTFPPARPEFLRAFVSGLGLAVLLLGYGGGMAAGLRGIRTRGLGRLRCSLLSMPLYWLLISAAAWLALWQFIRTPHVWNKTRHGLSRTGERCATGRDESHEDVRQTGPAPARRIDGETLMGRPNRAPRPSGAAKTRERKGASPPSAKAPMAEDSGPFRKGDIVETPWQRNRFVVIEANGLDLTVHRLADEAKEPLRIDARDVSRVD
jgi:cellulose synthase/poly-beta-1,6-N-acetylglucosamine synthase-like glycosyltransferase